LDRRVALVIICEYTEHVFDIEVTNNELVSVVHADHRRGSPTFAHYRSPVFATPEALSRSASPSPSLASIMGGLERSVMTSV
jgi:hypothetical protein